MKKIIKLVVGVLGIVVFFHVSCFVASMFASRPDVTFVGKMKRADGIGGQVFDHQKIIHKAGGKTSVKSTRFSITGLPFKQYAMRWLQRVNPFPVMGKVIVYEGVLPVVSSTQSLSLSRVFRLPLWGFKKKNHIIIAYSMFESTAIPEQWVSTFNRHFDAIAVPDPFLVDVYKKSGVTIPIFVVPLGVHYGRSLVMPLKSVTNKPFVFSNLSVVIDRKNTLKTIQAFIKAFGDRPDVQLRLNGREFDAGYLNQCRHEIKKSGVHNVHITTRSLSRDVFNRCLHHSDCYISLSKGEGFSLIPREAMALGVPVIVTDNTGQSTIAQSGLVGVVPSRIEQPASYHIRNKFFAKGINYDFDIDDAVAAMRHVVDNHDDYLKRGPQCRQWAMRYAYTNPVLQKKYIRLFLRPMQARIGECDDIQEDGLVFDRNNPSSIRLMHKYIRLFALNK